jgi:hypothetical protein
MVILYTARLSSPSCPTIFTIFSASIFPAEMLENNGFPITRPGALDALRFDTLRVQDRSLRFYSRCIDVNRKPYTVQVAAPIDEAFEALERFRMLLLFCSASAV